MTFDEAFPEIDAIPGWYTKDELRLLVDTAALFERYA